ncbi:MAG: hypothetical protein AAFO29_21565, partial [Actinomycetota bacterium]
VDLVVVDILVYLWRRPPWMSIPGVETAEAVNGYWFHVRDAGNGLVLAVPIALAAGALAPLGT